MNENTQQNENFPKGKYLKAFLKNGYKYEGIILNSNQQVVIIDEKLLPRYLMIADISNYQILEGTK